MQRATLVHKLGVPRFELQLDFASFFFNSIIPRVYTLDHTEATTCICLMVVSYCSGVDLEIVARGTPGFSGADLANLINQAALHGSALGREAVIHEDLDFAK